MPTYRTGNNAFCLQQVGQGAVGAAPNTANFVAGGFFARPDTDIAATYLLERATEGEHAVAGPITFTFDGSGALQFGGAAPLAVVRVPALSGGIVFGGAATTSSARQFVVMPAGGIVFGAAASIAVTHAVTPSGGVQWSGTAAIAGTRSYIAAGAVTLSGAAPIARSVVPATSGGMTFAGDGAVSRGRVHVGSGAFGLGGSAETEGPAGEVVLSAGGSGGGGAMRTVVVRAPFTRTPLSVIAPGARPAPAPEVAIVPVRPAANTPRIYVYGSTPGGSRYTGRARTTLTRRPDDTALVLVLLEVA